jgi:hypothetical protein
MVVSDEAFVMLLVKDRFKDFTTKELVDSTRQTEAILALSAESRNRSTSSCRRRSQPVGGRPTIQWIRVSCTPGASRIPTGTSGKMDGSDCPRGRGSNGRGSFAGCGILSAVGG